MRETLIRTRSKYIVLIGALARREGCRIKAGIMFAVWRDGTEFDPLLLRLGGAGASPA